MKRLFGLVLALFLIFWSSVNEAELSNQQSQSIGVTFEELSFDEVITKAQELNKPILVDVWSYG